MDIVKKALVVAGLVVLIGAGIAAVGAGPYAEQSVFGGGSSPVAEAGENQLFISSTGKPILVELDGSESSDPDSSPGTNDDILGFEWSEGGVVLAMGERTAVPFAAGSHFVVLTVTDRTGARSSDYVLISIQNSSLPRKGRSAHGPSGSGRSGTGPGAVGVLLP